MPRSRATMNRSRMRSLLPAGSEGGNDAEKFVSARTRWRKGSVVEERPVRLMQTQEDLEYRILALDRSTAAATMCIYEDMIHKVVQAVRV